MTTEEDTSILPIEKQCVHKSWKVRKNGYEEAIKLFVQLDEKATTWNKFTEILKNFVTDSNVAAQEKGLEATLAFIENSAIAGRVAEDVMTGLVTKCYGSPKVKIKDIAIQITLMLIEIEKQDVVIEELIKGMDHKFPKIVSTCIRVATQGINMFGTKVLNTKFLLKKLQLILEDKDKSIRDEAKLLAIEIYSWIGLTPVKANLTNLKPVQIQELEAEFEKVSGNKPQPTRFLRSKQVPIAEKLTAFNEDAVLEKSFDETDDLKEHIDPVNILSQLGKDFYEKLETKQWQGRKEAIEMLEGILTQAPKLESGDYGELVRALKKRITKDTNVVIVGISAKCMTLLAKGLKKQFDTYASACIQELLEKFKEKKQNVVLPLRDAVDAIYLSTTIESIQEDILAALNSKNPSVKAESVAFLARCFTKCTPTILNKKMLKIFTTVLIKTLNESDPIVRDNSAEALGTAWKVVSEKNILPYLTDVDPIKLVKIKEAALKVVITAKPSIKIEETASILSRNVEKKGTAMTNKCSSKKSHTIPNSLSKTITKAKKLKNAGGGCQTISSKDILFNATNKEIDDDELEKLALTFCSQEILIGMIDANWKTRLSCVQEFSQIIDQIESPTVDCQVFIQLLNKKPGIKDGNLQVQKLKLECLKKILEKFPITRTNMNYCIYDITSLLGDNKNGNLAGEVLSVLAESTRLDLVCNEVLEYSFNVQKNPKVQTDALNWLAGAILEFGFIIEPKSVLQHVKKAVSASNPQVRAAVISLLGILYLYMGSQLKLFFENEKPNLVQLINAEFEKHQEEAPPKPTRGKKKKITSECSEAGSDDENLDYKVDLRDIVPRIDITPQITDDLINAFADKDWKVRSNAVAKLQNIISEAKFITSELGEIREPLNYRISDSNARLSSNTINLVEMISGAMGSSFKIYIKDYLPGVLNALGDPKTFKCQSARQCINTWADVCGYREFFGGNILYTALKNTSVTLRSELWTWLAEKLPIIPPKIIPAEELKCLLPLLYASLEDKNSSIRNASERAVIGFMQHLGYASMYGACEKLKPMSVKLCRAKLDKERPNLPSINIEKLKVVKPGPLLKSKGSKMPPKTTSTNVNKENVVHLASVTMGKKKEEDNRPLLLHNNLKHQRDIDEHKLKSLKWNFITPREEFVDQLQEQMFTAGINKELITNMFHADFKYHLIAIVTLSKDLNVSDDNYLALISNLDLILKWITLRFFDTNPSVLIKGLEYLQQIFDILMVNKYTLHDTEASSFVPYLVKKLGDPKDTVKTLVRVILNQIAFIYPTTKLFQYIMDGIKSKNSRQRSECLEHLTSMIKDYGTSICQPNVSTAFKVIVKSIGDRDKSVRAAALNCFVAAFFEHGDALFKLIGNISEKDMDLLRERIKRASKNRMVSIANLQPTTKLITPPIQQVHEEEKLVNDEYYFDSDENNVLLNISQESNHDQSPQYCSDNLPSESEKNIDNQTEDIIEHSSLIDAGLSEVINKPKMTRFTLDEKIIQELDAIVIKVPQLILKPYHWNPDNDEINFKKIIEPQSQSILDGTPSSFQPRLSINSCSNLTYVKLPENQLTSLEYIQLLINQISSQNIEISESAIQNLNKIISRPNMRLMLLENDKISSIFYAIIKQLKMLSESINDVAFRYKSIFDFCLNVCSYREFILKIDEQIFCGLLVQLLYLLSIKELVKCSDMKTFDRSVNNVIMNILERPDHTLVTCSLLVMLYDMVKCPQDCTTLVKELLLKCIWKMVKDFEKCDDGICYDLVLAQIHRFLEKFYSKQRENRSTDIPVRACLTLLFTMVKIHKDKVLKSLAISNLPKDSSMVVYIHRVVRHFNSKH